MVNVVMAALIAGGFGCGGFGVFYTQLDMSAINDVMQAHGVSEFPSGQFGFGGGGFGGSDRVIFGGMGYGFQTKRSGHDLSVEASGGAGMFNIGYNPLPGKPFKFFGIIGIGGAGYTWTFKPTQEPTTFDSLVASPKRFAEVEYGAFGFEVGGMLFLPLKQPKDTAGMAINLALKASYFVPVFEEWTNSDGTELLEPPDFSYSGPSISFFLMFGGEKKE